MHEYIIVINFILQCIIYEAKYFNIFSPYR